MFIGINTGVSMLGSMMGSASVLALFAGGVVGLWFDPNDRSTLFQDTAGTTPITAPGQTAALMLDKSKGLALGPELRTAAAAIVGSWTQISGVVTAAGSATTDNVSFTLSANTVAGRFYEVTIPNTMPGGSFYVDFGSGTGSQIGALGASTQRLILTCTAPGSVIRVGRWTGSPSGTIGPISVKELPGYHATQPTAAQRPTYGVIPYGGVRNFANGSADGVNNAVWLLAPVASGITASKIGYGFDTDGLPYADYRFQGTATSTFSASAYQVASSRTAAATGQTYTVSLRCQRTGGTITGVNGLRADVVEETAPTTFVGSTSSTPTTSASEVVISASRTVTSGNQMRLALVLSVINGATIDVTYRIKALQFEPGSTRTAYQFNYSKYNVTEPDKATIGALFTDGIDDGMVTPSIDFSGTDKMTVWAGVQKLSDAARGMLIELGTGGLNTFSLNTPNPTSAYTFVSFGSVQSQASAPITSYPAPNAAVITGISDISGDRVTLQVNGVQVAQSTSDQGTGNYSNNPIYLFRRGGSTLPFNGIFTGLIVRGAQSSAAQISNGNTYINSTLGAY